MKTPSRNVIAIIALVAAGTAAALLGAGRAADAPPAGARAAAVRAAPAKRIRVYSAERKDFVMVDRIVKSDEEWKKELPSNVFRITRQGDTERAFTGAYWDNHEKGVYRCAVCGNDLFTSDTKFESGTGWPSFWKPIAPENVDTRGDASLGMDRTEVRCARCGSHLGHIFDDGPKPTGLRYCINSAALAFQKTK